MFTKLNIFRLVVSLMMVYLSINITSKVSSQIIPDDTLDAESSTVNSIDELRDVIEGGAIRGNNLFHSFLEFNVGEGANVNFANPDAVTNIFSRVTGENISEIFGTLEVDGNANLFFMNPNGIIFGENAQIDVNGSFMATTAESIDFNNGDSFSAVDPDIPQITIDFPIGLGFGSNPGDILVRGTGNNFDSDQINNILISQFNIKPNKTLSLIGGDVTFDGAIITIESGGIDIGSVNNGDVKITTNSEGIRSKYEDVSDFQNINFDSGSLVSTQNGGNIFVKGNIIVVNELSNFGSSNLDEGVGGNVFVESNRFVVTNLGIVSSSNFGRGIGGNVFIKSNRLDIINGGTLGSGNLGSGIGGNVFIESSLINIDGVSFSGSPFSTISASTTSSGAAGNLSIDTSFLTVKNGAEVSSSTLGSGSSGTVTINSTELIEVKGISPINQNPSKIIAGGNISELPESFPFDPNQSLGIAGNIFISTPSLQIIDGALVTARNSGINNAGNLNLNAERIFLDNGGEISASSISGEGGNIALNTENLQLLNQSNITASAGGKGNGGNIRINSESILGINNSDITANAVAGNGGNITIDADYIIGLKERSRISSGSDITVSSEFGFAGSININPNAFLDEDLAILAAKDVKFEQIPKQSIQHGCLISNRSQGGNMGIEVGRGSVESSENYFDRPEDVPSTPLSSKTSGLIWQPNQPIEEANSVVRTKDGRTLLVNQNKLQALESQLCYRSRAAMNTPVEK